MQVIPFAITGMAVIKQIACGSFHTAAVSGTFSSLTLVRVGPECPVRLVCSGGVCFHWDGVSRGCLGVAEFGDLFTWGQNKNGELGIGNTTTNKGTRKACKVKFSDKIGPNSDRWFNMVRLPPRMSRVVALTRVLGR